MELNSIGAALKFAMALETRALEAVQEVYQVTGDPENQKLLLAFADENRMRTGRRSRQLLQQTDN